MKFLASFFKVAVICAIVLCFSVAVSAQTAKPKPKLTPAKKANASQPGTTKPKATATKAPTKSSATKVKVTTAKPKATSAKPKISKPKSVEEPKPDEKIEWEKAVAVTDAAERISAMRKFLAIFPSSEKRPDAQSNIVTAATELGTAAIAADDTPRAAEYFKIAATDAPKPVPEALFNETLAKFPANLYFRGARKEAFEIAALVEEKAATNLDQLLAIANFYMSVENGAEARRVAENAIKISQGSASAYQTLGLASRIDFRLDESAAAYAKALELDPDSLSARRGLAEMKRAIGRSDEAATLYREILSKDAGNVPAQTGLVLALFDSGKRSEAEAEMSRSLEANPGNVILLASASYWYAVNKNGEKAVSLAQQAVASDPRFIWSHIALARGYLEQNRAAAAEKTLLAARRYGNFPTLEYEIASARLAAGFYREAADELVKSFSVKDGVIKTNLGGRVARESKDFTELVGFERRASIFAPTAADSPENAVRLTALLELKQQIETAEPKESVVSKAIDDLVRGDDRMRVHRQLYAANQLLERRILLPKVLELAKAAVGGVDVGLDIGTPSQAVMASELYENRTLAITKGEYIDLPEVPRQTLSAIMRGRIEEIAGWALYQTDANDEAIIRLKRAVGVLPADSAWWRSSTWRLASALAKAGKDAEALDWYIKSYKTAVPNAFTYGVIENLYKKVNGSTEGLELKIGAKPATSSLVDVVAAKPDGTPDAKADASPVPSPSPAESPKIETPAVVPTATPEGVKAEPTPTPDEAKVIEPKPEATTEASPVPSVVPTASPTTAPTPETRTSPPETPVPTPLIVDPRTVVEPTQTPADSPTPMATPSTTPEEAKPTPNATPATKELFPSVIISIPKPSASPAAKASESESTVKTPEPTPTPSPEPTPPVVETKVPPETTVAEGRPRVVVTPEPVKPCTLTVSEDTVTLQSGGGDLAVIVGRSDDAEDLDGLTATSTDPDVVSVRREQIAGVKARALFVLRPGLRLGVFQVRFQLPCGKKDIVVRVR